MLRAELQAREKFSDALTGDEDLTKEKEEERAEKESSLSLFKIKL